MVLAGCVLGEEQERGLPATKDGNGDGGGARERREAGSGSGTRWQLWPVGRGGGGKRGEERKAQKR